MPWHDGRKSNGGVGMSLDEIVQERNEFLIRGYNPDRIVCNEKCLRVMAEDLTMRMITKKKKPTWKDLIGGKILGMQIAFDPNECDFSIYCGWDQINGK